MNEEATPTEAPTAGGMPIVTGYHVRPTRALMDGRVPPWVGRDGRMDLVEAWLEAIEAGRSAVEFMCRGAESVGGVGPASHYLQEAIFEHVRRTEFPTLAPRVGSTMSFPTLARCQSFAQAARSQYGHLYYYEVALTPPQPKGALVTVVDMALFTVPQSYLSLRQFYDPAVAQARLYWASATGTQQDPEILMYGVVKVVRQIT